MLYITSIVTAVVSLLFFSQLAHFCYGQSSLPVSCTVPPASSDKTSLISNINGDPIPNAKAGSRVPKGTTIDFRCAKGYVFNEGTEYSTSFCRPTAKGEWQPAIKPCLRFCPPLQTTNVELTCKYNDREVDCETSLLKNTLVIPRCKDLHHVSQEFNPDYTSIRCRNDGTWSKRLFKCDPNCGIPLHETLIIGGDEATLGQFPWHVAIYAIPKNHLLICSGTLIASNVVLSAAHCFYDAIKDVAKKKPSDYVVVIGKMTRNYTKVDSDVQKVVEISEILFYDKPYNPKTNGYSADIAIIILKERVPVSTYVLPACFRAHNKRLGFDPGKGTKGVLAGWGIGENGIPTEKLKTIKVPFIPFSECETKMSGVTHDKFCAGTERGARPHLGDSGGGLIFKAADSGYYYVRGIVSTTEKFSEVAITTFTDVSYYQEWIDRIIQERLEDEKHDEPSKIVENELVETIAISQCCQKYSTEMANRRTITKRETGSKTRPTSYFRRNGTSENTLVLYGQRTVLKSMTNLMLKLNRILSKCFLKDENVLFAPFNIAKSLSVMMLGTGGNTELEMANAIGPGLMDRPLNKDIVGFHSGMGRLLRNILAVPPGPTVSRDMSVASGIFLDDSLPSKDSFKEQAMKVYRTEVHSMNFSGDGSSSTNFMNQWIQKKTFGGIKDNVISSPISSTIKLMFACVVYFNGEWEYPFQKKNTKWQTFYLNADGEGGESEEKILVEMMTNRAKILSYVNEQIGFRAIGIPYKGGNVVMFVVLPDLEMSVERLSCLLRPEDIEQLISEAQPTPVFYSIPKMKMRYKSDMRYALQQLNATALFDPKVANFSNAVEVDGAYMNDILLVTHVEVDELGNTPPTNTTAAVKFNKGDVEFRVNRPFVFFMYNINVGIVTFWSSVKKPTPFKNDRS